MRWSNGSALSALGLSLRCVNIFTKVFVVAMCRNEAGVRIEEREGATATPHYMRRGHERDASVRADQVLTRPDPNVPADSTSFKCAPVSEIMGCE